MWVNFNSPLVWDVFAITTYFTVSADILVRGTDSRYRYRAGQDQSEV